MEADAVFQIVPQVIPAALLPKAYLRLAIQAEITQLFPGFRVKIFLQGDGQEINGMEARFGAFIFGQGPHQGKKAWLNALTREGLQHQATQLALMWQDGS